MLSLVCPKCGGVEIALRQRASCSALDGDARELITSRVATADVATARLSWRGLTRRAAAVPVIPLVVGWYALRVMLADAAAPLGKYDEGLLFTNAYLMNEGFAPYRDFYSNYAPGVFQPIRVLLALGLPAIWSSRVMAWLVRLATGLCVARLARRAAGRSGLCLGSGAAVCALQATMGLTFGAYPLGVLCVLLVALAWPAEPQQRLRRTVALVLLGLLSYIRHDLFVYTTLGVAAVEGGSFVVRRRSFFFDSGRESMRAAALVAAVVLVLWIPVIVASGMKRPLYDLVIDQALRVQPARVLPIPPLFDRVEVARLGIGLPSLIADRTCVCLLVAVLGIALGAFGYLRLGPRDRTVDERGRLRLFALLMIFAVAALPQALQRTDYWHVAYIVPLAAVVCAAASGNVLRWLLLGLAVLPLLASPPSVPGNKRMKRFLTQRDDSYFLTEQRRELVDFVHAATGPQDRLFVGCTSHYRVGYSSVDLLYWSRRLNASRYIQFDPGLVTSVQGQLEMVADLERTKPPLALRESGCRLYEPNASQARGGSRLDRYLARQYKYVDTVAGFEVWRRRDQRPRAAAMGSPPGCAIAVDADCGIRAVVAIRPPQETRQ